MANHLARRQAQQRAAAARAVAPQRTQEALNRMASKMGIPLEDAAPNPILPANYQNPDAVTQALDTALSQPSRRPGLRQNPTARVITDAAAFVQQSTIPRQTTTLQLHLLKPPLTKQSNMILLMYLLWKTMPSTTISLEMMLLWPKAILPFLTTPHLTHCLGGKPTFKRKLNELDSESKVSTMPCLQIKLLAMQKLKHCLMKMVLMVQLTKRRRFLTMMVLIKRPLLY
jgi:hypothetical protein